MTRLRFGVLGTASVNAYGFLPVIRGISGAECVAVASRDGEKAARYASKHAIRGSYGDYDELLADPGIDCVYVPLPVSMHAEWSLRALSAGKHVLCEKPVAMNAAEAETIARAVEKTGLTFAEGFHYRYHPLCVRVEGIIRSGGIGGVREIKAAFGVPLSRGKIQFRPELGGGALLDVGCYPVSFARWVAGCETATVASARADVTLEGVDASMSALLEFENGVRAEIKCSIARFIPMSALVRGTAGAIFILSPFTPAVGVGPFVVDTYLILVRRGARVTSARVPTVLSYRRQLEAFCAAVRGGAQPPTNAREAVANMRLIDAIFRKAGLRAGGRARRRTRFRGEAWR
ncbi:MAG: Gfo/Idh/MocA family oxidoreductase [bacterium]